MRFTNIVVATVNILFLCLSSLAYSSGVSATSKNTIAFRNIIESNVKNYSSKTIIPVTDLWPYDTYGTSLSGMYVDLDSGIDVENDVIQKAIVRDIEYAPDGVLVYSVQILFSDKIETELLKFSTEIIGNKVAVMFDNDLFVVSSVLEGFKNDFMTTVVGKSKEKIIDELANITQNIYWQSKEGDEVKVR